MKAPSPPCFEHWEEHDVMPHEEWVKRAGALKASVQRMGANWGYLIVRQTGVSFEVIAGKFDWDWTAMDACDRCEKALAELLVKGGS